MAESIFSHLRTLGSVEVRRLDSEGGFALVEFPGLRASVEIYLDRERGCEAAVLSTEAGEHLLVDAAAVPAALLELGRAA